MRIRLPYIGAVLLWLNAVVLSGTLASEWLRVPDTPGLGSPDSGSHGDA